MNTPDGSPSVNSKTQHPEWTGIFDSVEAKDTFLIAFLSNAILVPSYDEVKKEFGFIQAEYLLLLCLAHIPMLTAQDVSTMTRRPRNSISRAVHRLLKDGYLNRVPDPDDGRQAKLSITESGRAIQNKISKVILQRESELLQILNETEREDFQKILRKLALHASTLKR